MGKSVITPRKLIVTLDGFGGIDGWKCVIGSLVAALERATRHPEMPLDEERVYNVAQLIEALIDFDLAEEGATLPDRIGVCTHLPVAFMPMI